MSLQLKVENEASQFATRWNRCFVSMPELRLDGSWPSVGTVDLILHQARNSKIKGSQWESLVRAASCYLAMVTRRIWIACGIRAIVSDDETGVVVTTYEDPANPWHSGRCRIQWLLEQLLEHMPPRLQVMGRFSRPLLPDHSVVSPFMVGVVSGLAPWTDYPESTTDARNAASPARLDRVERVLATDCVQRYEQMFPDDPHGQVAELFLSGPIFPPLYLGERYVAERGAKGIAEYFTRYNIPVDHVRRVCHRLARWPDEQIALTAYVVASAVVEKRRIPELVPLGHAKGLIVGHARHALISAREIFGGETDWLADGELTAERIRLFRQEEELGFIPWLYLHPERISAVLSSKSAKEAFRAVVVGEMDKAVEALDEAIDDDSSSLDLRLQQAFWYLLVNDIPRLDAALDEMSTERGVERSGRYFELRGVSALTKGDPLGAVESFERALTLCGKELALQSNIANSIAWICLTMNATERANYMLDLGLRDARNPVTLFLNKLPCLERYGLTSKREACEARLMRMAPTDRRVINLLVARELFGQDFAPVQAPTAPPEQPAASSAAVVTEVPPVVGPEQVEETHEPRIAAVG